MTWKMSDKEFEAVLTLSSEHRYDYFVKRVADWGKIYSLWNEEGWVLAGESKEHELIPVWPHTRFAQACVSGIWAKMEPRSIEIHDWLDHWIPGLIRDQRMIAVFPVLTPSLKGIVASPERLRFDIDAELSRIE